VVDGLASKKTQTKLQSLQVFRQPGQLFWVLVLALAGVPAGLSATVNPNVMAGALLLLLSGILGFLVFRWPACSACAVL